LSSKTTYAEISPSELAGLYQAGWSIDEIAGSIGRSYTFARNRLLESGTAIRTKAEGTHVYISRHPEWSDQFVKYRPLTSAPLTDEKVMLLALVLTEGYVDRTSFGFTNTQEVLQSQFSELVAATYGDIRLGRNRITSRGFSIVIAQDLASLLPQKTFSEEVMRYLLDSPSLTQKVMRIVADTEGAFLISVRRAKRNFTIESRIVLASSNEKFTAQISTLLSAIAIEHKISRIGVTINRKTQMERFIRLVGFSDGVKVVRKRAGLSVWYGREKAGLQRLFRRISSEQRKAKAMGLRGAFADCITREDSLRRLMNWYAEENGGDEN
jgi:hypothetical protein